MQLKPKKYFGQHFLEDEAIAKEITDALLVEDQEVVLEIGPGMGVLTKYLVQKPFETYIIDIDQDAIEFLREKKMLPAEQIISGDFLKMNLDDFFKKPVAIIGNFPYNISSQIIFKTIEFRHKVTQLVGMFQKEVAKRICAKPGSKTYGIISVITQAFYSAEYLFTVPPEVFHPPPKVDSGVIRLQKIAPLVSIENEKFFVQVVKSAFNQRRKKIKNSLSRYNLPDSLLEDAIFDKRPEELSVGDFISLTSIVGTYVNQNYK